MLTTSWICAILDGEPGGTSVRTTTLPGCGFMWLNVALCGLMWLNVALCDLMWLYVALCLFGFDQLMLGLLSLGKV